MRTINRLFFALKYWTWQPWKWETWYEDQSILLNWKTAWSVAGIIVQSNEVARQLKRDMKRAGVRCD